VPSLMAHHNAISVIGDEAFWRPWVGKFKRTHPFDLIMRAWMAVYQGVADYRGPVTVWNYGFWDEWKMPEESIEHLYARSKETSSDVMADIESGKVFSDATANLERWEQFIEEYNVTPSQLKRYQTLRNHLERAFRCRGRKIRFLD